MAITESTRDTRLALLFSPRSKPLPQVSDLKVVWAEWQGRRCYRKDLNRLLRVGPYMIEDIGLPHEEAIREMAKPFWRA